MKSIEQANDLINIAKKSGSKWSHEFANQYKRRLSSLKVAEDRQIERFNFGDEWAKKDAEIKLDDISETRDELVVVYCKLFNQFKERKNK